MDSIGDRSLGDWLGELRERYGDRTLAVFDNCEGSIERFTYDELIGKSYQLAQGLIEFGIEKGDRVILHADNGVGFLLSWWAVMLIGGVVIPTNTANTLRELRYILEFTESKAIITSAKYRDLWCQTRDESGRSAKLIIDGRPIAGSDDTDLESLLVGRAGTISDRDVRSSTLAQIIFTSGTTALPKGVMLTHANILWSAIRTGAQVKPGPRDILLTALPLFHVNAQSMTVLCALSGGATIVILAKFSATQYWEQVRTHRATMISIVPALLRTICAQPIDPNERDHCVEATFYAINCTDDEKRMFEERFRLELINGYGLSEAMTIVTMAPKYGRKNWPSIGLPAIDRNVKIVDASGVEMPFGEVGEIIVQGVPGRSLMLGYYKNEEATKRALINGWLHTEDSGYMDEKGYVYFFDRKKDMIKRGGENISASEVELVLLQLEGVLECAVIGVDDPIKDQAVKAFVVLKPGSQLATEEIREYCRQHLARFKVPEFIEYVAQLPKTSIGKIAKGELRKMT